MPSLIQIIKQAAIEAVEAANPMRLMYGTVDSTSPLSVKVDQRFSVPAEFLKLTSSVRDYEVEISSVDDILTDTSGEHPHQHEVNVRNNKFLVKNSLKVGDKVILLQEQGGQSYIILDRIGGAV